MRPKLEDLYLITYADCILEKFLSDRADAHMFKYTSFLENVLRNSFKKSMTFTLFSWKKISHKKHKTISVSRKNNILMVFFLKIAVGDHFCK